MSIGVLRSVCSLQLFAGVRVVTPLQPDRESIAGRGALGPVTQALELAGARREIGLSRVPGLGRLFGVRKTISQGYPP